jgi:hypothetical protein
MWDSSWESPERRDDDTDVGLFSVVSGDVVPVDGLTVRLYLSSS